MGEFTRINYKKRVRWPRCKCGHLVREHAHWETHSPCMKCACFNYNPKCFALAFIEEPFESRYRLRMRKVKVK